jgi:outer membrane receptor protein involved in Fe transport
VDHQYRLDERSFVQTLVSWNRTGFASRSVQPVATEPLFVIPEGFRGRAFHGEDRRVRHWQLKSAYTRAIGEAAPQHVLQFGVDLHSLRYSGESRNDPIEIRGADDRLIRRTEFVDAGLVRASKWEASVFAQDRWRPSSRFWIDAGLRLTWDGATGGGRLAPRLGAAWAPFRNERTLLKASAGVLYRRVFFGEQIWASQPTRIETSFADDGAVWVDEVVPRRGRELDAPRAILSEVQLSHRFSETLSARVRYAKRNTRKQLIFDRVAGPDGETSLLLTNDGSAFHDELELTANVRVGQRGQLFVSYVRSRGEGDINTFGLVAGESPEAVLRPNERGPLAASTPNRLIGWGVFDLPWAIELAPVIEWRSGFPYSVLEEDQSYAGPPNAARFPHYLRADINITKGFGAFGRRFRAGLQVINLTARYNPRQVIANRASMRFGEFLNSEGLRLRLRFSAAFF